MHYAHRPAVIGCNPGYGYAPLARANVTTGALSDYVQSAKDTLAKDSLGLGVSNGTLLGVAAGIGIIWYGAEAGWFR